MEIENLKKLINKLSKVSRDQAREEDLALIIIVVTLGTKLEMVRHQISLVIAL